MEYEASVLPSLS